MKKSFKDNKWLLLFSFLIFLFVYLFFTNIHALVISDTDDWTYITEYRRMMPIWGSWNPSKVFPEIFFPLVGSFAAYIIYPITHNYFNSFTIVSAFVMALLLAIYFYLFVQFIVKKFKLKNNIGISIGLLFFFLHFLLFVNGDYDNTYLFWAHDLNCYYNYLIPNLLCFGLIFLSSIKDFDYSISFPKNFQYGCYLLVLFLAIFSNLYCSIILVLYVGVVLLEKIIQNHKNFNFISFIKQYFVLVLILLSWIISAIFEYTGLRASHSKNIDLLQNIKFCISNLFTFVFNHINHWVLLIFAIIFILFVISYFRNKKKENGIIILRYFACTVLIAIYLILLCAKVDETYILRVDCMYGLFEYGLILLACCCAYLLKKHSNFSIIIPFIIAYSIVELNGSFDSLPESNVLNMKPKYLNKINNDIVLQVLEQYKSGSKDITIYVPKFSAIDNWPYTTYLGNALNNAMLKHHFIDEYTTFTIIPDETLNSEYNIQ